LPGAGVRDFAGPHAYNWALVAFLVASLIVYSLLCMISPNVLSATASGQHVALGKFFSHAPHAGDRLGWLIPQCIFDEKKSMQDANRSWDRALSPISSTRPKTTLFQSVISSWPVNRPR